MKKKLIIYLLLFFMILPIKINGLSTYNDAIYKANRYLETYKKYDYTRYIRNDVQNPVYDNDTFSSNGFRNISFLSKSEYEISSNNNNSYLATGIDFWTSSRASSNSIYILSNRLISKIITDESGVRVAVYTKPTSYVSGNGTYLEPWEFLNSYTLFVGTNDSIMGTIDPNQIQYVLSGTSASITYNTKAGYKYKTNNCTDKIRSLTHNSTNKKLIFSGFYKDISCVVSFEPKTYTFYLDYNPNPNVIYLKYNDGFYSNVNSNKINKLSTLPQRIGYTFDGYMFNENMLIDNNGNIDTSLKTNVNTDIENYNLYASWTANTYYIEYNANSGTGTMSNTTHHYDETSALSSNLFTKTGYSFSGWNTKADGSGTSYINGQSILNLTSENNKTIVLYAQWTANAYTLTYNANGGSVSPTSKTIYYDSTYGTLSTPTKTGYTFNGWYTAASGGTQVTSSTLHRSTSNVTIYAHWTAKNYTLTYNANGGSVSPSSKTITYDSAYGTLSTPTRTGYTFNGWYTSLSGGTQVTSSTVHRSTSNVTIYAHWTANTYTIVYNKNNGSGSMSNTTCTYGISCSLRINSFTRSYYNFLGWSTNSSATSPTYTNGQSVINLTSTNGGTVTLYAIWKSSGYTLTFNSDNGDSTPNPISVPSGTPIGTLPTVTKTGYKFGGWYTSTKGRNTHITETSTITSNTTVYAFWYRDADYLKNYTVVSSGSGLYNSGGTTYYYKGGGCSDFLNAYGYAGMCLTINNSPLNNYIKVANKTFRILQIDSQGIKIFSNESNNTSRYAYNTSGYTYTGGELYQYYNGSYLNSINSTLVNEDKIIKQSANFKQTVVTAGSSYWNDNGHLYYSWNWYVNAERSYGSTYTATIGLLTPSEICYHSTYIKNPNSSTTIGYSYSCAESNSSCGEVNFCGRNNWLMFNEGNYSSYTGTSYYPNGTFYVGRDEETRVSFVIKSDSKVYIFDNDGFGYGPKSNSAYSAKPTLYLQSTVKFTGSGTKSDPYVVWDNY